MVITKIWIYDTYSIQVTLVLANADQASALNPKSKTMTPMLCSNEALAGALDMPEFL